MSTKARKTPPAAEFEPPAEQPKLRATRTVSIEINLRAVPNHDAVRLDWCTFAAAVAALADQIPEGRNPAVDIRGYKIIVSWPE